MIHTDEEQATAVEVALSGLADCHACGVQFEPWAPRKFAQRGQNHLTLTLSDWIKQQYDRRTASSTASNR